MIALKEVKHIAQLARIQFSEKELENLQKELSSILDYFNKLKQVSVENVEATNYLNNLGNVIREDSIKEQSSQTNKKLLDLAAQTKGRFVKVKSVF